MPSASNSTFRVRQVTRPRDQVEEQLREAILDGHFGQGDKLPPESELAHMFGVSRPTVREALGALDSAGLIRKVPGAAGGSFVNTVSPDSLSKMLSESMDNIVRIGALDIAEITALRRVLEVPAAELAARNRSGADIEKMKAVIEKQKTTTIDDPDIPEYDLRFHTAIGFASGNRLLAAFIAAVHDATHPAQFVDVTREVALKTIRQHIAIVSAIEAAEPASAASAMEEHLDFVLQYSLPGATSA